MPQPRLMPSVATQLPVRLPLLGESMLSKVSSPTSAMAMPRISSLRSNDSPWRTGRGAGCGWLCWEALFLPNGSLNIFFLGLREEEAEPPVVLEGVWRCVFPEPVFLTDEALPGGAALAPGFTGLLEDLRGAGAAFFWAMMEMPSNYRG